MVKVKVIKRYHDLQLKRVVEKDETFEVSDERAKHLVKQKMAEIVQTTGKAEKKTGEGKE